MDIDVQQLLSSFKALPGILTLITLFLLCVERRSHLLLQLTLIFFDRCIIEMIHVQIEESLSFPLRHVNAAAAFLNIHHILLLLGRKSDLHVIGNAVLYILPFNGGLFNEFTQQRLII